jgi:hypothetical protein
MLNKLSGWMPVQVLPVTVCRSPLWVHPVTLIQWLVWQEGSSHRCDEGSWGGVLSRGVPHAQQLHPPQTPASSSKQLPGESNA